MNRQKLEKLKSLIQEIRDAKQERQEAQAKMSFVDSGFFKSKDTRSCIKYVSAIGDSKPPLMPTRGCDDFSYDNACNDETCPCFEHNQKYFAASEKLWRARKDLIKAIFERSK